jgi:hypothetical protein
MPRSWTYRSPNAFGQPKRHAYRSPSTAKEYHPNKRLAAIFARASGPRRKAKGGRKRRRFKPRYRARPKFSRPKR